MTGVGDGTKFGSHLSSIGRTASRKPATSHCAVMVVRSCFHTLAVNRLAPFIPDMNASVSGANVAACSIDDPNSQTPSTSSPSSKRTATVG